MIFTPGTPPAYLLAILGFAVLIGLFAGFAGMLISGFFFDIGYSVDPYRWCKLAAIGAGILAIGYGSWASWQDYHLNTPDR